MQAAAQMTALVGLLLNGAIFGFFYAWVCSTMWGLDQAAPQVAVSAMRAMNASVRNAVFAPAFFATGPVLVIAAALAYRCGARVSAGAFAVAGVIYFFGGTVLTMLVNVPMNEALALVDPSVEEIGQIWSDYSAPWQFSNQVRTVFSGLALLLAGYGLLQMHQRP